uniref:Na_Ca_ex domain-containing protein n=1 Tax=Syphacia muris TaxID=451379 RepID=A0A0N5AXW7_9BILA
MIVSSVPLHRYLPLRDSSAHYLNERSSELKNCTDGIKWIEKVFSDCVDTNLKLMGFVIGFISLILWLLPLIPQLIQHYRRKRCEGLSVFFLLFWIVGDTCNMLGAILTNQQPMQKVVFVLLSHALIGTGNNAMASSTLVVPVLLFGFFASTSLLPMRIPRIVETLDTTVILPDPRRKLFQMSSSPIKTPPFFNGYFDLLGYIFGSISALCYFLGRIPQLIRNYNRQSCEGLSLLMFYIIISANLTYGLSVLLETSGWHYVLRHLPWLAGSLGCCICDIGMVAQYYHYERLRSFERDGETSALLNGETDDDSQA